MRKINLTVETVAQGLRDCSGNMAAVARQHGVTRTAVYKYIKTHPSLHEVKVETKETMKDNAESALQKALLDGEGWAVCFFLKTQAKDRGYIERSEFHAIPLDAPEENLSDADLDREIEDLQNSIAGSPAPKILSFGA